jgi:hypothetical protein
MPLIWERAKRLRIGSSSLWDGSLYGLEILRHLENSSDLVVVEGTVYPPASITVSPPPGANVPSKWPASGNSLPGA